MVDVNFEPIARHEVVAQTIVEQLAHAILIGQLQPGDKLVEERLAEQFGVSRVPVREALRLLEQRGLVDRSPYRGAFVSQLSTVEIFELHSLRKILESMAVRLLTEKQDPVALDKLEAIVERMRQQAQENDRARILLLDADFHDAIVRGSGHELLGVVWDLVSTKLRRFLLLKRRHTHRTIQDVVISHERILNAIRSGEAQIAVEAVCSHLSNVETRFKDGLKDDLQ